MIFLRWLGALIILFWLVSLIFKIGGGLINLLLLLATLIFVFDALFDRRKSL
ncbi:MAG TPA: DUF5670 family protein [Clostridiaceae bacterium]